MDYLSKYWSPEVSGGAPPAFTPTDIASIRLWIDASQESFNDNDAVGTATDFSGYGNHLTQGTAAAKPTFKTGVMGTAPAFYCDGGDSLKNIDYTGSTFPIDDSKFSAFIVIRTTLTTEQCFFNIGAEIAGAHGFNMYAQNNDVAMYFGGGYGGSRGMDVNDDAPHIIEAIYNQTSTYSWLDGVAKTTTTYSPVDIYVYADDNRSSLSFPKAGYAYVGYIAEIIIYGDDIGATNRGSVETYLKTKYGIS